MECHSDIAERRGRIRERTSKIAKERISPDAAERDRSGSFPLEAIRHIGEAGLAGPIISEADGGGGEEARTCFASVVQEIARACASTALMEKPHGQ